MKVQEGAFKTSSITLLFSFFADRGLVIINAARREGGIIGVIAHGREGG